MLRSISTLCFVLAASVLFPTGATAEKVWTSFTASDTVYDIAIRGDNIWCATANGPVRWDRRDMSYMVLNDIPDNRVKHVALDVNGDVWFGGQAGIYRWNGTLWSHYSKENGLPHNNVSDLELDRNGIMHAAVSSYPGLYGMIGEKTTIRYSDNRWTDLNLKTDGYGSFTSFSIDKNGGIWAVSSGKIWFYEEKQSVQYSSADGLPEEGIEFISIDKQGTVWAASKSNVCRYNGSKWKSTHLSGVSITAVCAGPDSGLIVGTAYNDSLNTRGVATWDGTSLKETFFGQGAEKTISALVTDSDGTIYVGTKNGLYSISSSKWKQYPSPEHLPVTALSNVIQFVIDKSNIFWLANPDTLLRFDGVELKYIPVPKTYPTERFIKDLKVDDNGRAWLGTNTGVMRYDGKEWIIYGRKEGFDLDYAFNTAGVVEIAFEAMGKVWAVSPEFPYWFDGNKWNKFSNSILESIPAREIGSMTFSSDGSIWFGALTYSYFTFFSDNMELLFPYPYSGFVDFRSCRFITFDSEDNLWAVTYMGDAMPGPRISTVVKYKGNELSFFRNFYDSYATAMICAPDNTIWISSLQSINNYGSSIGGGLVHFIDKEYVRYTTENGIDDNSVISVACSPDGTIWAKTNSGFTRYGEPLDPLITRVAEEKPASFPMLSNFPNPFNPSTTLFFSLSSPGHILLAIYNIAGQKVRELASGPLSAGSHAYQWDGKDNAGIEVSSGVYFARLKAGSMVSVRKMAFVR
jgi:ligand-binding sensor domain-containing protein